MNCRLGLLLGFVAACAPSAATVTELPPEEDGDLGLEVSTTAFPRGVVSFTFDDGYLSQLTEAARILGTRGFAATEYIALRRLTEAPDEWGSSFMRWDDLTRLQREYGWEIASHSISHPLLTEVSAQQLEQELRDSKAQLLAHGFDTTGFAAPYGDYNDAVLRKAAALYRHFRPFHDTDTLNAFPVDRALITVKQVQSGGTEPEVPVTTVAEVKGWIDQAVREKAWLVLVLHDLRAAPAADLKRDNVAWGYGFPNASLEEIADYCLQQRISVRTVAQVLAPTGAANRIANGGFTNGLAGFQTDAPVRVTLDEQGNGAFPSPQNAVALRGAVPGAHLFGPRLAVRAGSRYTLEAYVDASRLSRGSVGFYVDEWDAQGRWVSGQYIRDVPDAPGRKVQRVAFRYQAGAAAKTASLQIILSPSAEGVAYVDELSWHLGSLVY